MADSFQKEVWDTFQAIDVTEFVQVNQGAKFLNWSRAWSIVMEHYPRSEFDLGEIHYYDTVQEKKDESGKKVKVQGRTAEVECSMKIIEEGTVPRYGKRTMRLPVMASGGQFLAIIEPSSRQISDARMRCLVKILALFGLGTSLWAGEEFEYHTDDETIEAIEATVALASEEAQEKFWRACGIEPGGSLTDVPKNKLRPALRWIREQVE